MHRCLLLFIFLNFPWVLQGQTSEVLNLLAQPKPRENFSFTTLKSASDQNAKEKVKLARMRDPQTGTLFEIQIEKLSPQELKEFSPQNLQQKFTLRNFVSSAGEVASASVRGFPGAASVFYGGSFAVAFRQVLLQPELYPNALQETFSHQIADPVSHGSFLAFTSTQMAHNQFYSAAAISLGWMRDEKNFARFVDKYSQIKINPGFSFSKDYRQWSPREKEAYQKLLKEVESVFPIPKSHAQLQWMRNYSGFFWAFNVSGLVSDLLHDENFYFCSLATHVWGPERISQEIAKRKQTPTEACQKAWDTWMSSEKIYDYAPDIASSLLVMYGLGSVLPKFVSVLKAPVVSQVERVIPVLIRGLRYSRVAGSLLPVGRLVASVGHVWAFLEGTHLLTPLLKDPFEMRRQGARIAELENSLRSPKTWREKLPEICLKKLKKAAPADVLDKTGERSLKVFLLSNPDCQDLPLTRNETLKEYNEAQKKWRSYWLSHGQQSMASWQKKIEQAQIAMTRTKAFYEKVISELEASRGGPIFVDEKQREVSFDLGESRIRSVLDLWAKKKSQASAAVKERKEWAFMVEIENDFKSGNLGRMDSALKKIKSLKASSRESALVISSTDEVGLLQAQKILEGLEILTSGMKKLKRLSEDASLFPKENEKSFPSVYQRFSLRSWSEYLMVTMLCGPSVKEHLIRDWPGVPAEFSPPRVTDEIDSKLCRQTPLGVNPDQKTYQLSEAYHELNGQFTGDFWLILREKISKKYLGPEGLNNWKKDWENSVQTQIKVWEAEVLTDFKKLFKEEIQPALLRRDQFQLGDITIPLGQSLSYQKQIDFQWQWLKSMVPKANLKLQSTLARIEARSYLIRNLIEVSEMSFENLQKETKRYHFEKELDLMSLTDLKSIKDEDKKLMMQGLLVQGLGRDLAELTDGSEKLPGEFLEVKLTLIQSLTSLYSQWAETVMYRKALSEIEWN